MKLDLACGQHLEPGFDGVDAADLSGVLRVDLTKFPWPWKDASVDEARCSHFVEHLPARDVEACDVLAQADEFYRERVVGKDFLFAFFDECYRILKPGARLAIAVPCGRSNRAFQDPTHRRFIVEETFSYLGREFRAGMGLGHYKTDCDFAVVESGLAVCDEDVWKSVSGASAEVRAHRFRHEWGVVGELRVTLEKR